MNQEIITFNLAASQPKNGLYWLAGAIAMVLASFLVQHIPFVEDVAGWRFVLRFLSALPMVIGAGILTLRQGVRVDKRNNRVESWKGIILFQKKRSVPIDKIYEVNIEKTIVQGRQRKHVFHAVMLIGPDPHILIWSDEHYPIARDKAEQIATFLELPLRDEAVEPVFREDGSPIKTRAPGSLNHTLKEQAIAQGAVPPFPVRPHDCRIHVTKDSNGYVFELPPLAALYAPFDRRSHLCPRRHSAPRSDNQAQYATD